MKKIFLFWLIVTIGSSFSLAQSDDINLNNNSEVDSLKMVVQQMQSQMDEKDAAITEMENEKRYEKVWGQKRKYTNLGYCIMNLDGMPSPKSKYGFCFSMGKTYNLHKKPLAGMIMFGIDFSYLDMTFASFNNEDGHGLSFGENLDIDLKRNYIDYTLQVGPSVSVNPIGEMKISAYGRFAPSVAIVTMNDYIYTQFVPYVTCGLSVSYRTIGIGIEGRWGKANYKGFSLNEDIDDSFDEDNDSFDFGMDEMLKTSKKRFSNKSFKVYLSFRF